MPRKAKEVPIQVDEILVESFCIAPLYAKSMTCYVQIFNLIGYATLGSKGREFESHSARWWIAQMVEY